MTTDHQVSVDGSEQLQRKDFCLCSIHVWYADRGVQYVHCVMNKCMGGDLVNETYIFGEKSENVSPESEKFWKVGDGRRPVCREEEDRTHAV